MKVRKGLSYVLGDDQGLENHILPINAMQFSKMSQKLYTGARDGTVKEWSCNQPPPSPQSSDEEPEVYEDIDEKVLKLETAISSNPLPYTVPSLKYVSTCTHNIHFDWINDLRLVNNDKQLVSCSSDLSLKMLDLESDQTHPVVHRFPNIHTDYIKKLSYIGPDNAVVSGGLDGKVVVWDLETLAPVNQFDNVSPLSLPSSIYSLANNNSHLLATGGPSSTINIFDQRSGFVRKLIGHHDNIRSLLMNDRFILSGSSDSSIKLWDLRNFKVYKNFDIHDDAVWSLSTALSSSPGIPSSAYNTDFTVFYSGDKSGKIIKTDLSHLSSNVHDDLFPGSDTFTASDWTNIDEKLGMSMLVAETESPVLSLCVESSVSSSNDISVFSSSYSSLDRSCVPSTDQLSRYQYLRTCLDYSISHEGIGDEVVGLTEGAASETNDLASDFYDIVSHLSMDTNNFDLQSSFSGTHDYTNPTTDDDSHYTSMFLNVNGDGPSLEFINAYKNPSMESKNALVDETPVEILLNPIPVEQIHLIPFNKQPLDKTQLTPKSIIAKKLFNNKRWMLVLYLNGDIKIWDVFICKVIKTFPYSEAESTVPMNKQAMEKRLRDLDDIFQQHQTIDTLTNWCEIEIKSGKLLVTLKETSFNNVEIYYDDMVSEYPFLQMNHPDNVIKNKSIKVNPDDRFYVARILLKSILRPYAMYEWNFDHRLREELRDYTKSKNIGDSETVASDDSKMKKMFSRKSSKQTLAEAASPEGSTNSTFEDASTIEMNIDSHALQELNALAKTSNEDSILQLLQFNKRRYIERYNTAGKYPRLLDSSLRLYSNEPELTEHYKTEEVETYKPMIHPKRLPANLLIIVFESSPELGNYRDVCSFHFEDLLKLDFNSSSSKALVNDLRVHLPKWIGQPVLYDSFPAKSLPKIAFLLLELDYVQLPPEKKIGGKSQRKIKKLPVLESSIKLTSHNMLRVSKILLYLTEKFDSRTAEMKDHKQPTDWLVLECKGKELPNHMTLQTIKTQIWKSSSDIELRFRRKFDR